MMRRWFRRKDKDRAEELEAEEELAPEPEAEEPEAPAAEALPGEAEGAASLEPGRAGEPRPYEVEPAGEAPVPPAEAPEEPPQEHHGFFARFRKSPPAAEPAEEPVGAGSPRPESPPLTASCAEALVIQKAAMEAEGAAAAEPEAPAEEAPEVSEGAAAEPRRGVFRRFRERLSRTREAFSGGLERLLNGRKEVDAALLEELEEMLISADLGVETSLSLIHALEEKLKRRELEDITRLRAALQAEMLALLSFPPPQERTARPWVVLLVGVNGVGKTTTIAKLAHQDRQRGLNPLLVAADTFRAAAAEQLEVWGERVGAPVIRQQSGADPAAVVFDGLAAALSRGVDRVYIDTAGRLHTKVNLMEELKKIHRTAGKKLPGAPHEILLVLDATTGQNALSQARLFQEAVGISGIVLTKLDGTAKGGVALAVAHETGVPLRYVGVGEGLEDLRPFDPEAYVAAILG